MMGLVVAGTSNYEAIELGVKEFFIQTWHNQKFQKKIYSKKARRQSGQYIHGKCMAIRLAVSPTSALLGVPSRGTPEV
jgi:hypothetical protein